MTGHPQLTNHELTALRLLAYGRHHSEIARELGVRPETAGQLLHRARTALHARTLSEAVARGCSLGIIPPVPHRTSPTRPGR
ncbi:hypothetical protein ACFC34_38240 [Streptomyces sp. NPDC056053]|uniref:hypothetical protein n=1 Tax=Streptomyces sp. NPDC056053 TaxID=3345696 RepID=UPI0035E372A2